MTAPDEQDPLVKAVRKRGERHIRWLRDGDPSAVQRLAQIGVLGWIIVVPMLIGVGTKDKVAGSPHELAALVPGAHAIDIPGRDHMLAVGDRVFKEAVLGFLAERS